MWQEILAEQIRKAENDDTVQPVPERPRTYNTRPRVVPAGQVVSQPEPATVTTDQVTDPRPRPVRASDAVKTQLDNLIARRNMMERTDASQLDTNKDSKLMNIGKALRDNMPALQALLMQPNLTDKQALGVTAGIGLGSVLSGLLDPYGDERRQLEFQKAQLDQRIGATTEQLAAASAVDLNSARIDDVYLDAEAARLKLQQQADELEVKAQNASTNRANTMIKLVNSGRFTPDDNEEFVASLGEALGTPVTIDNFDPKKDALKDVKVIQDAEGNKAYVVRVMSNGEVKESVVKGPDGKPAFIKDPRVKAEEIRSETSKATTKMRLISEEQIQRMKLDSEERMTKLKLDDKKKDRVESTFRAVIAGTDEDAVIRAVAADQGKTPDEFTAEEKTSILDRYFRHRRQQIEEQIANEP